MSADTLESIAWAAARCELACVRGDLKSAAFWSRMAFEAASA